MRLGKKHAIVVLSCLWMVAWALGWLMSPAGGFESLDYVNFVGPWVQYIRGHGYYHALGDWFTNYMPFYSYLLLPVALIPGNPILGVKVLTVLFNIAMGLTAGGIVATGCKGDRKRWIMWPVASIVTSLPTVTLETFPWGQCDSIYATFALGCILMLIKRRGCMAMVMMGLALSMKLQGIFVAPVIYYMLLKKELKWWKLIIVPATILATMLPAMIAGRPLWEILMVYPMQAGEFASLSMSYPNFYLLVDGHLSPGLTKKVMIIIIATATLIGGYFLAKKSPEKVTPRFIVWLTLACGVLYPFLLPGMHSRYMLIGEVMAVVAAFYNPRSWWLAVGLNIVNLPGIINFLAEENVVAVELALLLMTILVIATVTLFHRYCYPRKTDTTSRHQSAT